MSKEKILIVGADGLIGSSLKRHLEKKSYSAIGTTRRKNADHTSIHLDLLDEAPKWEIPANVTTAVLCAGITKIAQCSDNPVLSNKVNVVNTFELAKKLSARGIHVIYLSSNQVFNGRQEKAGANTPYTPANEYGKQKAQAEQKILSLKNTAVLRLTKVLTGKDALIVNWSDALLQKKAINPFSDYVVSVISLGTVMLVLERMIENKTKGIVPLSAPDELTYAQIALIGAKFLGVDANLVRPMKTKESNHFKGEACAHSTFDITRVQKEFNITVPDSGDVVEKAFKDIRESMALQ